MRGGHQTIMRANSLVEVLKKLYTTLITFSRSVVLSGFVIERTLKNSSRGKSKI